MFNSISLTVALHFVKHQRLIICSRYANFETSNTERGDTLKCLKYISTPGWNFSQDITKCEKRTQCKRCLHLQSWCLIMSYIVGHLCKNKENNITKIMPLQITYFYKAFFSGFGILKKEKRKQKGCQTETASGFAPPVIYSAFFLSWL